MNYIRIVISDDRNDVQVEYDGASSISEVKLQLAATIDALDEAEADEDYRAQRDDLEPLH